MSSEEEPEFMSDGESELHFSVEGLGQFHEIDGVPVFVKSQDSLSCLRDVLRAIRRSHESAEEVDRDRDVEIRLGQWETVPKRLVPLFLFYREDSEIVEAVLKVLVILTRPLSLSTLNFSRLLRYLQDYKQLLADEHVMVVLMALLMDAVKLQEQLTNQGTQSTTTQGASTTTQEQRSIAMRRVELVMALVKNLLSIPDARSVDPGYVPGRENLGLTLLGKLQEEGILDLYVLFAENTGNLWLMFEIYYGLLTQMNPQDLVEGAKQRKPNLAKLLEQNLSLQRADVPLVFRHSRFGPQLRLAGGELTVGGGSVVNKPARNRQYDRLRVQGERLNVFQDRAFTDLKGREGTKADSNKELLVEMKRFFELFIDSSLTHVLGGVVKELNAAIGNEGFTEYDYVRVLNVFAWTLEFQRLTHRGEVLVAEAQAKADAAGGGATTTTGGGGSGSGEVQGPLVPLDVSAVQWCVNEHAVALVLRELKKHTKEAKSIKFGGAMVVVCLRALLEQLRIVGVLAKHRLHKELQDVAHEIFTNIMYDDVGGLLLWVLKNYAVTAHDPRVLQLALECLVALAKDMEAVEKVAGNFYVTKSRSKKHKSKKHKSKKPRVKSAAPVVPGEDSSDAASIRTSESEPEAVQATAFSVDRLVLGLTHKDAIKPMVSLVSKFRDNGRALNSALAFLFFRIIRLSPEAIGIFFQLSTLVIFRDFLVAPEVRVTTADSPNYADLLAVVREIVRRFFQAFTERGRNELLPLELLFPRTFNELELKGLVSHYSDPAVRDWLIQDISDLSDRDMNSDEDGPGENVEAEILRIFNELKETANTPQLDRRQFTRIVSMVVEVLGLDDDGPDRVRLVLARQGITQPPAAEAPPAEEDDEPVRDWRGVVFGSKSAPPHQEDAPRGPKPKGRKLAAELLGLLGLGLTEDERTLLGRSVVEKFRL